MPYVAAAALFVVACILQQVDDLVYDMNASKLIALVAQYIFLAYLMDLM